jgi:hypothetical protein
MRTRLLVLVAGATLVFPAASSAQTSGRDSVSLTGAAHTSLHRISTLTASSGPSGENPSGQVSIDAFSTFALSGPVTCLSVTGNTAILNFEDATFGIITVQVIDGQPDVFDPVPRGRAPTDCSVPSVQPTGGGVEGGDIVVVDAPPLPTSNDECKNGGWQTFGVFKNQGDCVSFVATGGKNPPANSP